MSGPQLFVAGVVIGAGLILVAFVLAQIFKPVDRLAYLDDDLTDLAEAVHGPIPYVLADDQWSAR